AGALFARDEKPTTEAIAKIAATTNAIEPTFIFHLVSLYAMTFLLGASNGKATPIEMPALAARETIILLWLCEAPESNPHLEGIDPRIWRGEAGIGNMHEPHLRAPIVLAAQEMQSQRARSREVYPRGSRRHLRVSEQRAAPEFKI